MINQVNVLNRTVLLSVKLCRLRIQHGLTLKQVAHQTGVGYSVLCAYERNRRAINIRDLYRLAKLYRMGLDEMVQGTEYDVLGGGK